MPLIHIYLNEGKTREYKNAVSDALHEAFLETWNIPEKDRFQIFHETTAADLQIDKEMWDVTRTDDNVVFHVFTSPRTADQKLAFYERLPQILEKKVGLRPEDCFVSLASNQREDWSFAHGKAQLLEVDKGITYSTAPAMPAAAVEQASTNSLGGLRSLSTTAAQGFAAVGKRPLTSLATSAPCTGGPVAAVGRLGLVAACGVSAFFGGLASTQLGQSGCFRVEH